MTKQKRRSKLQNRRRGLHNMAMESVNKFVQNLELPSSKQSILMTTLNLNRLPSTPLNKPPGSRTSSSIKTSGPRHSNTLTHNSGYTPSTRGGPRTLTGGTFSTRTCTRTAAAVAGMMEFLLLGRLVKLGSYKVL